MSVRSLITEAIHRLPGSQHVPERVMMLLEEENTKIKVAVTPPYTPPPSASEKVHAKLLQRRAEAAADEQCHGSETSTTVDPHESHDSAAKVEAYLAEQNRVFDLLIRKNLDHAAPARLGGPSWHRLVWDLSTARNREQVVFRLNAMLNKASESIYNRLPFRRTEPRLLVLDATETEVLGILDSLDYDTKLALLRQLLVDLGSRESPEDVLNVSRGPALRPNASTLDKVELLMLLWVRLSFIGLRYCVPITQLLYRKFSDDELLVVNNTNMGRLLTIVIRSLEAVDDKLGAAQDQRSSAGEEPRAKGRSHALST